MKKNLYFMSALLAAGTLGLNSCSSEKELAPVNPTYDSSTNTVKTQFAVNIPAGVKTTRMSDLVVQNNFQFNGMQNIFLAAMENAPDADGNATYTSVFRLPSIVNQAANESGIQKIYEDVTVPVLTKNFIFWGESAYTSSKTTNLAKKAETGVLKNNLNDNSVMTNAAVRFQLEKIAPQDISNLPEAGALVGAITDVTNVANNDGKTWRDIDPATTKSGEKVILKLMKAICQPGLRWNASHVAITNILNDLKTGLSALTDEQLSDGSGTSVNTKGLRNAIVNTIDSKLNDISKIDDTFPENLGLPQGCVVMEYMETNQGKGFSVVNISSSSVTGNTEDFLDVQSLCFPPTLNYFVNTSLRAKDVKPTTWPSGVTNWIDEAKWDNWSSEVQASTQAIALKDNINYSVGRLDVGVRVANITSLDDNTKTETTPGVFVATPSKIPSNMFKVTGIAVGGQPVACDWRVLPVTGDGYSNTVWDNQVSNSNYITTDAQTFCKTLVLDNNCKASTGQKNVVVAVEIVNGSETDFRGYNGVIKAGAKFYMIAMLNPGNGTKPAGISAEESEKLDHVFVQDHITTVTFTMKDLKGAYIGIPDLRSSDLQLGLSVDLKWEPGLTYTVDFQ